jgi:hypothetical protein
MILRFTSRAHLCYDVGPEIWHQPLADAIIAEMAEALVEIGDTCRAPYRVLYSLIAQEMTHDSRAERATRLSARPWDRLMSRPQSAGTQHDEIHRRHSSIWGPPSS